jgi:hypothetical protein
VADALELVAQLARGFLRGVLIETRRDIYVDGVIVVGSSATALVVTVAAWPG